MPYPAQMRERLIKGGHWRLLAIELRCPQCGAAPDARCRERKEHPVFQQRPYQYVMPHEARVALAIIKHG